MSLTLPTGSSDDDIYIGFWTNYSSGTFLGATLTLSQQNGNLLLAFLALFIGASGRALWTIIRFILHTSLSTTVPRDAVYHQQQAVLRNTPLAHDAAIDLLRASFVWHQRTHSVRRRVLPVALLAAMISALSVAASITSSKALLTATNEALISGRLCGKLVSNNVSNNTTLSFSVSDTTSYFNRKGVESFAHVTQCGHGSTERLAESCGAFVKSSLPFTSDKNASCPFSEEMCKSSTRNLLLDSGDIDSLSHLGLNTGPRFIMRHQSHCAPLNTQNLTEMTESQTGERHLTYRYGFGPEDFFTYRLKPDGEKPIPGVTNGDYKVSVIRDNESDTFIPQLRSSNGYVSLIFLDASEVLTFNETDDPWFEGTPLMYSNHSSDSLSTKTPGVIGCITRRFYCNPSLPAGAACVNGFAHNTLETLPQIWNDSQDLSVIRPILSTLSPNYLDIWYYLRSVPTLLSRNTIMAGMQMDILPDDRWQAEREHLFRASLVSIQSTMTDYARGFWLGMPGLCSNGMQCWKNCRSQKVRSSRHFSFSVLALVTILLLGSLIMISSAFVERINEIGRHIFTRRSARNQTYAQVEWRTNSTLQLQRVAHENLGLGDWAKTDKAIPVTDSRVTLGVLDISNTKHARLVRPGLGLKDLHVTENDADAVAGPRYTRLSSVDQSC